tara:strand:- start:16456 stop:16614 length:159 start_codon:yes stop_codon:yes gene_type:complete
MKNIKWLVLGYFMAMCIHGCDLGIGSNEDDFEVSSNGLGSSPYNPVYVRIVD